MTLPTQTQPLKCQSRPPQYEYMVYDGDDAALEAVYNWLTQHVEAEFDMTDTSVSIPCWGVSKAPDTGLMVISNYWSLYYCRKGDYIFRDGESSFRNLSADEFNRSYITAS